MLNNALRQRLLYRKKLNNFTGKELDAETGLYYYGARYLDPKTSRWLSGDPALGEYFPSAPVNDEAKKRNGNLPGQGGVFNYVNLHAYHYAGNNPVKLVDPDGKIIRAKGEDGTIYTWDDEKNEFYSGSGRNKKYGSTDPFIKDVKDSLVYLKGSKYAEDIINKISINKNIALISKDASTYFHPVEDYIHGIAGDIGFNNILGIDLKDGTTSFMSPAMSLFHEISHAYSHLIERKYMQRLKNTHVSAGDINAENANAVSMSNIVAARLGEPIRTGGYNKAKLIVVLSVTEFRNRQGTGR